MSKYLKMSKKNYKGRHKSIISSYFDLGFEPRVIKRNPSHAASSCLKLLRNQLIKWIPWKMFQTLYADNLN